MMSMCNTRLEGLQDDDAEVKAFRPSRNPSQR